MRAQNEKDKTSIGTNLRRLHLRLSPIALRKGKPIFGLVINKAHLLHCLGLVPVAVAICAAIYVILCISADLSVCISIGISISRLMEYRPCRDLACRLFHCRELLQLVSSGSEGGDASELYDLFDRDGGASFDSGRVRMLLIVTLNIEADVEYWVRIVIAVDRIRFYTCRRVKVCQMKMEDHRSMLYLRGVHAGLQLIQERRHIDASSFSSKYGLLHGEDSGPKCFDAKIFEFSTGLETFPCAGDLNDHP